MALSKSSVLHYWSSRYGINPRIGGRPVFTRNSAGLFTTQEGEVDTAIVNTPRFDWATLNLPSSLTERRKVLTLELARSNQLLFSTDHSNGAWTKTTMTVTTGIPDPAGGTAACTLTATGAFGSSNQTLAAGASIVRTSGFWLRRRNGTGAVTILRADGGANTAVTLTSDWQRFSGGVGAASTVRQTGVRLATSGDAVDVWNGQLEDGPFGTADIVTGAATATRATDSCYWNFPPVPQAMMVYVRFVEQGSALADGRICQISNAADANPRWFLGASGGFYVTFHVPGAVSSSSLAAAPSVGDTAELVAILFADGSVQIIQSINGAAVTSAAQGAAAAISTAWSDTRLWCNSFGTSSVGSNKFAEFKFVKYADVVASTAQGRMDELRAFELGPNGDVL